MRPIKKTRGTIFSRWLDFDPDSKATILPLDQSFGLPLREQGITLCGKDQLSGHFRAGTKASPTHLAWFVVHGHIQCELDSSTCIAQSGDLLICPAGQSHYLELRSERAMGLWFHLRDLPRWEHLYHQEATVRPSRSIPSLTMMVDQLLAESTSPDPLAESMARHYGELIALTLRRELSPTSDSHQAELIQRLSELWKEVEQEPAYPWTTDELATRACVSSSYLYKITERFYETSPMKLVLRLRMRQAMALLTHTDLLIENIATEIGYQTAYAFSNAFTRDQGIRPGAYRQKVVGRVS